MTIFEERQLGRAKNAALSHLEKHLSVPKIYIDAVWADTRLDVLAIDRDGVGDVHAVLLLPFHLPSDPSAVPEYLRKSINPLLQRFVSIPAQYKYVALVDVSQQGETLLPGLPPVTLDHSFSPDGIGRVGFLSINFPRGGEPVLKIDFKPERFRASVTKLADQYVQQHEADWEIRA